MFMHPENCASSLNTASEIMYLLLIYTISSIPNYALLLRVSACLTSATSVPLRNIELPILQNTENPSNLIIQQAVETRMNWIAVPPGVPEHWLSMQVSSWTRMKHWEHRMCCRIGWTHLWLATHVGLTEAFPQPTFSVNSGPGNTDWC